MKVKSITRFSGGISDFEKEEQPASSHAFLRGLDHRRNPRQLSLLPRATKESGTTVQALPKWASTPGDGNTYIYDASGNLYRRTSGASYSLIRAVANSHGNGLGYFGDDDYLYYTSDKVIGRYGPLSNSPQFSDDFLGAQGGVPQNTASLDLESGSSQYASRADTATLSITGDLAIEAQIKSESLPTTGNSMVLVSKWDESGTLRSYKFEIAAISGYFGDGSDGSFTVSVDATQTVIDSDAVGTSGNSTLTATNASFAAGQVVIIHQTRGSGAGTYQRNKIISYSAGTIVLENQLNYSYDSTGANKAQVFVLPQYSSLTINTGITWTGKKWNGTVGGFLSFLVSGTFNNNGGTVTVKGKGFRGGTGTSGGSTGGNQGEGTAGAGSRTTAANGNGGGGGSYSGDLALAAGGGANGGAGGNGTGGTGGSTAGTADLTTLVFGGGSGEGGLSAAISGSDAIDGADGGGGIFGFATNFTNSGSISANGDDGNQSLNNGYIGTNGGGGGGSILIAAQTATLGSGLITATGGLAGINGSGGSGGVGGTGRVHINYLTSYSGTTSPTLDATQDNSLVTTTTYQLRLHISSTGLNTEILSRNVSLVTANWQHAGVSWDASASTAEFFLNAVSQGTSTGALTAIHDNASTFQIGMSKNGAGSAANFYDGLIDEVRVWSATKTADDFQSGINTQISASSANLNAYYKLNSDYADSTSNANDLTSSGSPVFSVDVPFPSPSTRLDIDQQATTSGNTYTTPVAISEASTARKTFTPTKDPQKSIGVLIAAKGTGDWTLTVHDEQNRVIASKTVTNANLTAGYFEFIFSSVWRPKPGVTYHFHLTSTVADGTVTTTTSGDLETVSFRTYFQFLVEDTAYHPVTEMLTFLVIGNERYIGTLEAGDWDPNFISLSSGYNVRCFGYWNEFLVAGTWKGSTVKEYDQGRLYFWDGIEDRFNYFVDVPDGAINAILGVRGALFVLAGHQGQLLKYIGGTESQPLIRVPRIAPEEYADIYPQAIAMWRNNLRLGVAGGSDAANLVKAVYTYGKPTLRYEDSLSCDYPLSTGSLTGSTVNISLLHVVNSTLLVGWQDNLSYGVDAIDLTNAPQATGTLETLIIDDEAVWKEKGLQTVLASFKPLRDGESIKVKYKIDEADTWTEISPVTTVGAIEARVAVTGDQWHELQVATDLATSVATSPTLLGVAVEVDPNEQSKRV